MKIPCSKCGKEVDRDKSRAGQKAVCFDCKMKRQRALDRARPKKKAKKLKPEGAEWERFIDALPRA